MYAGLLNMAAVRKPGVNFFDTLPKYNRCHPLNVGIFGAEFNQQVHQFQQEFEPVEQNDLVVAKKIVMTYFRKGQLADLAFIVDKMLVHLGTYPLIPADPQNKKIYEESGFTQEKQSFIYSYVRVVAERNNAVLKSADSYVKAGMGLAVAAFGVGILLVSLSVGALSLGAAMVAGGLYSLYTFLELAERLMESLEANLKAVLKASDTMVDDDRICLPTVYGIFAMHEQLSRTAVQNREEYVRTQIELAQR